MTEEILPVFDPHEWARRLADPYWLRLQITTACDGLGYDLQAKPERLIALGNAVLPDDSPYKITRADVDALTFAIDLAGGAGDYSRSIGDGIGPLRAKLAALLQPE